MPGPRRTLIVGAAGRDFHTFNIVFRHDASHVVVGFTSPEFCVDDTGTYPASLAGPLYPDGIDILPEAALEEVVRHLRVDEVVYAYTEAPRVELARLASRALAAGADFEVVSPHRLMLPTSKPVIAVSSARPGSGKSAAARYLAEFLVGEGYRVAVVRHPRTERLFDNAYPSVQQGGRHARSADEVVRGEVAPHGSDPVAVFSGLDYELVLAAAEAEADVLIWDGNGSDAPFLRPTLQFVLVDPLRLGGEVDYFPGEVCLRMADAIIVNKCDAVSVSQIEAVVDTVARLNPEARVFTADSPVEVEDGQVLRGRTVTILEEVDSLRLDGIRPGAGMVAARRGGVSGIISPKPYATGSLARFYRQNPAAAQVLPVLGNSPEVLAELGAALAAVPSEVIIDAARVDLAGLLPEKPVVRASYTLSPHDHEAVAALVRGAVQSWAAAPQPSVRPA